MLKNLELFNVHEFALICNPVSNDLATFDQLLTNAGDVVMGWMGNNDFTNIEDLVQILHAMYSRIPNIYLPARFNEMAELTIV